MDTKNVRQINTDSHKHITDPEKVAVLVSECQVNFDHAVGAFVKDNKVWAYTRELSDTSYLFRLN